MKQGAQNLKSLKFLSLLFSSLTLCAGIAFGQAISGNLVGTVSDSTGAVVANAEVTVTNVGTSASAVAHTNATGEYRFDNLPVGTYRITVKAQGFRTFTEQANVELNKTGTHNARMSLGAASETVEVSGAAPAIDTTTAQLQSTYDPQYAQDLGLTSAGGAGAGVLNLSLLSPGVTNGSAMGDGVGPSVGGQRPRDNNFTVEGVDAGLTSSRHRGSPNTSSPKLSVCLKSSFSMIHGARRQHPVRSYWIKYCSSMTSSRTFESA